MVNGDGIRTTLVAYEMPSKAVEKRKTGGDKSEIEAEVAKIMEEYSSNGDLSSFELIKSMWPLKLLTLRKKITKVGIMIFVIGFTYFLVTYVEIVQWNLSAIGRIALSKLPNQRWESLYNARCLIAKHEPPRPEPKRSWLVEDDCVVCENLYEMQYVQKIDFNHLYDKYLLRGLPVVITDSHEIWSGDNFATDLLVLSNLMNSNPCDLQTNLIFNIKGDIKLAKLLKIVEQSSATKAGDDDGWYLHFRNCDFEAVKATRNVSKKPYYYAPHLEQPHTSWILMSKNFVGKYQKKLKTLDVVMVRQLKGKLEVILEGKDDCLVRCGSHSVTVFEGQALIFISKLWSFAYFPSDSEFSVTLITETYLN